MYSGEYSIERWPDQFEDADIFGRDESSMYIEAISGAEGNDYLIAALSSIARYPDLIKNAFLTEERNAAGIIGVKFFIRGKPWVITIDDYFLFVNEGSQKLKYA